MENLRFLINLSPTTKLTVRLHEVSNDRRSKNHQPHVPQDQRASIMLVSATRSMTVNRSTFCVRLRTSLRSNRSRQRSKLNY